MIRFLFSDEVDYEEQAIEQLPENAAEIVTR